MLFVRAITKTISQGFEGWYVDVWEDVGNWSDQECDKRISFGNGDDRVQRLGTLPGVAGTRRDAFA
jgi:hypothetical protein